VSEAEGLEREYRWSEAADAHECALGALGEEDFMGGGEAQERVGYCLLRAAAQSESHGEFRERMQRVVEAYERAIELYSIGDEKKASTKRLHCRALVSYVGFWLSSGSDAKRELLDGCLRLEREALRAYEEAGDAAGAGETCVTLANYLSNRLDLELETPGRERILDEALGLGERAIEIFSGAGDDVGLSEAYCITAINSYDGAMSMSEGSKIKECERKAFEYSEKAIKLSEEDRDKYVHGRATVFRGFIETDLGAGVSEGLEIEKEALRLGQETRDNRLLAEAYDGLSYCTSWGLGIGYEEDPDKAREVGRKGAEYSAEAIRHSELVDYGHGIPHAYLNLGGANFWLSTSEINSDTRYELLRKTVTYLRQGLEHAQRTGSTHATYHLSNYAARALSNLSTTRTGTERRDLLEEAMAMAERAVYYTQQLRPYFNLVRGGSYGGFSRVLLELSTSIALRMKKPP
jgi:tetratricopeptide (TPR) repeat protein